MDRVTKWLEYYGGRVEGDVILLPPGMCDDEGGVCYPLNDCTYEWLTTQVYYSPVLVGPVPEVTR